MTPFNFFQFFKKSDPKTKIPVHEIPLFSSLGPAELNLIENKIRRVEYKKGDIIYRIGEKAEAFYMILLGRFRVMGSRGETFTILSQGDYFGESSILLGRPHSATVEAKSDGLVLRIDKKDFQELLSEIPSLSLHLSRTLGHRLTAGASRAEVTKMRVVAICDYEVNFEKSLFARNLAAWLATKAKKKTILLGLEAKDQNRFSDRTKDKLPLVEFHTRTHDEIGKLIQEEKGNFQFLRVGSGGESGAGETALASLLGFLIDRYDFVLFDLPAQLSDIGVKALQHSDQIYFLVGDRNQTASKVSAFLKEFKTSFGFTSDEIRFLCCEEQNSVKMSGSSALSMQDSSITPVFSILPYDSAAYSTSAADLPPFVLQNPDNAYSKAIRFIGRELTGKAVGLALGSGAAYGFAHIGVLRVLEREQIPIDMIAGSSIGALIGGMWGSGLSADELEKIALGLDRKTTFFKIIGFRDVSLPHQGFFKGHQVSRFLRGYLGRKTFRELNLPVKIVTTNLFTGEEMIFDGGDLVEAIRASISIPGIFHPLKWQDQYLIDGGVVDPLPVKVLSRYGIKKIIAVNVLSTSEDHTQRYEFYEAKKKQLEDMIRKKDFLSRMLFQMKLRIQKRFRANVFNVLMNTIQFLEYGIAESSAGGADIVIHPVLHDSHWAEFYSGAKFIKAGEEKTREQLAEIKKLVEET
ncbi:MAG: patatin-like phospholipase family protein [Candidatus Omnitrophica bacterium]|nr:patatin-like phospholipase family protein [Candidatus Omnitrophota bacterium]